MTNFHLKEFRRYQDARHPSKPYSCEEILTKIKSDGLNSLEIVPRHIDEWHGPSAFFVNALPPSWCQPARYYDISTCCYLLRQDTDPAALADLFANKLQLKFNCRLSRRSVPAQRAVSVEDVARVLHLTETNFPGFTAPEKIFGEIQVHDLHRIVSRDDPHAIEYYTEAGQHIYHVIHETYHEFMFANTNVFGDMAASGLACGFGIQRPHGASGISLPPSFTLESLGDDAWDVYLVEGEPDQVAALQKRLEDHFKAHDGFRVTTKFPLPLAKYRLSQLSAEMLEFEEPYPVYEAGDFGDLAMKD